MKILRTESTELRRVTMVRDLGHSDCGVRRSQLIVSNLAGLVPSAIIRPLSVGDSQAFRGGL